jgi:hypothetical protein
MKNIIIGTDKTGFSCLFSCLFNSVKDQSQNPKTVCENYKNSFSLGFYSFNSRHVIDCVAKGVVLLSLLSLNNLSTGQLSGFIDQTINVLSDVT